MNAPMHSGRPRLRVVVDNGLRPPRRPPRQDLRSILRRLWAGMVWRG